MIFSNAQTKAPATVPMTAQNRINQRDIFQHVPITSRKPVKPDSKGVPGFFAFWGSSRILANPGAS